MNDMTLCRGVSVGEDFGESVISAIIIQPLYRSIQSAGINEMR